MNWWKRKVVAKKGYKIFEYKTKRGVVKEPKHCHSPFGVVSIGAHNCAGCEFYKKEFFKYLGDSEDGEFQIWQMACDVLKKKRVFK